MNRFRKALTATCLIVVTLFGLLMSFGPFTSRSEFNANVQLLMGMWNSILVMVGVGLLRPAPSRFISIVGTAGIIFSLAVLSFESISVFQGKGISGSKLFTVAAIWVGACTMAAALSGRSKGNPTP